MRKAIETNNKAPLNGEVREKLSEAKSVADVMRVLEEVKAERLAAGDDEDENGHVTPAKKAKSTPAKRAPLQRERPQRKYRLLVFRTWTRRVRKKV